MLDKVLLETINCDNYPEISACISFKKWQNLRKLANDITIFRHKFGIKVFHMLCIHALLIKSVIWNKSNSSNYNKNSGAWSNQIIGHQYNSKIKKIRFLK